MGSNGYVYLLVPSNGRVEMQNNLHNRGSREVRLAISHSLDMLFAGIRGYTLVLDSITLAIKWEMNLLGSGYEVASVVGGNCVAYAVSNGRAYRLSEAKG